MFLYFVKLPYFTHVKVCAWVRDVISPAYHLKGKKMYPCYSLGNDAKFQVVGLMVCSWLVLMQTDKTSTLLFLYIDKVMEVCLSYE